MSAPVCARCKEKPGPLFWLGSLACEGCYSAALEQWTAGVAQVLEAVEAGLMPKWAADKDLHAVTKRADWRQQTGKA